MNPSKPFAAPACTTPALRAAARLQKPFAGGMTAAGRIDPARVLVVGAGVAGLAAIQQAKNMNAQVLAFDVRSAAAEQVESMGAKFLQVEFEEAGDAGGGYAKEMSPEWFEAADAMLLKECENLDAIITTALIPGMDPPLLIKKNMVDAMPVGSVTIDLAAESGFAVGRGNVETTVPGEVFVTPGGVTSVGYTNWPSLMASTASRMYVFSTGSCFFSLSSVLLYTSSFHLRVVALPFRLLTVHPGFLCNRPHHCPHYCPAVLLFAPA